MAVSLTVLTLIKEWALCPESLSALWQAMILATISLAFLPAPCPSVCWFSCTPGKLVPRLDTVAGEVQAGLCLGRSLLPLLQVVSSNPYLGDGRGAASLRLLKVMHQNIHPLLGQRWETTMPVLLEYLDGEAR